MSYLMVELLLLEGQVVLVDLLSIIINVIFDDRINTTKLELQPNSVYVNPNTF